MTDSKDYSAFPNQIELDVLLRHAPEYPNSAFMIFDFDVPAVFGSKKVPVLMSIDGKQFRRTLSLYSGAYMMVFNAELREATGYKAGDSIHVKLERDFEERVVELPSDLELALQEAGALEAWKKWSYSHQKEDLAWVNDTRNPATRAKRIAKLLEKLRNYP